MFIDNAKERKYSLIRNVTFFLLIGFFLSCDQEEKPDLPPPGQEQEAAAVVLLAVGTVTVDGKAAAPGTIIRSGQTIQTGPNSLCDVQIREAGSRPVFRISANSSFEIQARRYDTLTRFTVRLNQGKGSFDLQKLGPGEDFQVTTPTTVASVRGTQFEVEANGEKESNILVLSGQVQARPRVPELESVPEEVQELSQSINRIVEASRKQAVTLNAGQAAKIKPIAVDPAIAEKARILTANYRPNMSAEELKKTVQSFDEETAEAVAKTETRILEAPPLKSEAVPDEELKTKLQEYEELIRLQTDALNSEDVKSEVHKRNLENQTVLVRRIEKIFNKPSETLVLISGQRIRGVVVEYQEIYYVHTINGQVGFAKSQVDGVEF